ncbi:DUF4190 domain-containing protein [Microbacterium testaceum]|uniref:DUF4190 domain-containing protein n=1 Tax=Microbacterium testaceum TaxID=2033 RepID=UPI0012444B63|nr:DUF4190 domain-containing protein [Microbacterium testaceum]
MASAELRLSLPIDRARDALAAALAEQGFTVQPTASGSLEVERGSLGTTIVAGAFAGQDMHVRFDVHLSEIDEGTLAAFEHSAVGGFFKGGAIGAAKSGDVVREAARLAGARLAQQGLLTVAAPAEGVSVAAAGGGYVNGYPGYASTAVAAPPASAPAPVPTDRTNVVAIVALVLGFVVPIGGIVAGAVALAQIKRTGEKGRGLAIGGIIAGGILSVVVFLVGLALVILTIIGAANEANDPFGFPQDGDVTIAPDEQAAVDPSVLTLGACLDALPGGVIGANNVVDCAQPHAFEIFAGFDLADGAFPGDAAIEEAAYAGCEAAYPGYVGVSYNDSTLNYYFVGPTEQTWASGDREVSCLLFDPATELSTGSLAGSGR